MTHRWEIRRRLMWQSVPAALGLVGVLALSIQGVVGKTSRMGWYVRLADKALQRGDMALARLIYEKLNQLDADNPAFQFGLLSIAANRSDEELATSLLNKLAPEGKVGYGPAHVLKAQRMLQPGNPDDRTLDAAQKHLEVALAENKRDAKAHFYLSRIHHARGRWIEEETHLEQAAREQPLMRLRLAAYYRERGNEKAAEAELRDLLQFCTRILNGEPNDKETRVTLAEALVFQKRFPEAVETLRAGLERPETAEFYRGALAGVYLAWVDAGAKSNDMALGQRIELLSEGLRYEPRSVALLRRFSSLMDLKGPEGEEARKALRALVAEGKESPAVHFTLGLDAWKQERKKEAILHFDEALRLAPNDVVIANNLAWLLGQSEAPDLQRALALTDIALKGAPRESRFAHTRGVILARLGRWEEALPFLRVALATSRDDPRLHSLLAETYEKLNAPEMAEEHRRVAARILREMKGARAPAKED